MGTSVLVVDGCPTTRLGVSAAFGREEDFAVVGEAGGPDLALCLAGELRPDLVVQELWLGGEPTGSRLCKELKGLPDPQRVLFHTARNSHQDVYSCYLAGADGFVDKCEETHRLVDAARQVVRGKRMWLLGREPGGAIGPGRAAEEDPLTEKEAEVLALVLGGCSNAGIAEELCLSCNTVKTHLHHVYRKLGVSGREGLFRGGYATTSEAPTPEY